MPTRKIARSAFLAFAVLGVVHAPAVHASDVSADRSPPSYAALMRMKPTEVVNRMDEDGKGYVTREDFMKFQESVFARIDRNGDGKLVATEIDDDELADRGDGGG